MAIMSQYGNLEQQQQTRKRFNIPLILLLLTVAVFEWLDYSFTPWLRWPKFTPVTQNSLRILVVGDPQLLGNHLSCPTIFNFICIWDADRYVERTFSIAYQYLNPDLVIFLGDNLDEGEIANDDEFLSYIRRFRSVFHQVNFNKAIFIPGDNDIGGEDEPPDPEKEDRFDKYFKDDVFIKFQFAEFVKVNYISHSNRYLSAPNISDGGIRIALSHIPLVAEYSSFISRVFPHINPHIVLSAHEHMSVHLTAERKTGIQVQLELPSNEFQSHSFNISETIVHEFVVPTCSYRMGTMKIGYSFLELKQSGEVFYAVLWLPSRFRQLLIYGVLILALVFIGPFSPLIYLNRKLFPKTPPSSEKYV